MMTSRSREVILEHIQIGKTIRVTAIDAETGTEIVFQAPVKTSKAEIEKIAMQKLKYVMDKHKS